MTSLNFNFADNETKSFCLLSKNRMDFWNDIKNGVNDGADSIS